MKANPEDMHYKKQAAISEFNAGHFMEAEYICKEICQEDPSDPEILCLLGMVYGSLNQLHKAAEYIRKALEIAPDYIDAHYNLGIALRQLGDIRGAGEELASVIARRADHVNAHFALGHVKMVCGEYQRAIECYRTVQRLDPGRLDAVAGMAEVYERLGEVERAYEIIQPYLTNKHVNIEIAIVYGKLARKLGNYTAAIDYLEQHADRDDIRPDARGRLHFILGSLCDKAGGYNTAYHHYQEGNQLKGVYFDSYQYNYDLDRRIERFSEANLARLARSSCQSRLPVFIVGMPRSGSSLVEQVLASHKNLYGAGELPYIGNLVETLSRGKRYGAHELEFTSIITTERLDVAANDYLNRLHRLSPGAQRITDKMPGNFHHLGYIELMFPNARVIHCRRNALDTCLSCYFQDFGPYLDYTFKLEDIGLYYLGYRKLMAHWNHVLRIPIHEVIYEELVENPEREIRRLVEFCGLQWDENCLRHAESRRLIRTASYDQANKPIYRESVGRWRNYEKHLGPLIKILEGKT